MADPWGGALNGIRLMCWQPTHYRLTGNMLPVTTTISINFPGNAGTMEGGVKGGSSSQLHHIEGNGDGGIPLAAPASWLPPTQGQRFHRDLLCMGHSAPGVGVHASNIALVRALAERERH